MKRAIRIIVTGVTATAFMDAAAFALHKAFGVVSLDYRLVGRWLGHMPRGRFAHGSIVAAPPIPGERQLGYAAHYAIGVGFAGVLDTVAGGRPGPGTAMAVGLGSVAAPWLVMQPAFGMGVAASKTANPVRARVGSLRAHAIHGAGLWVGGKLAAAITGGMRG
ncbi:DUF2938 family protein [Nocardia veterana]|uniref:DUF2938 family protein n=1 Tax=Nocardia veterana TaxID=132249 RepID=A0A7X6LZW4_9NOCA|nr:DUF2938 family protein [Nocardia veterana]NKY87699.1 DUF2938 family protein [Nocardia veterana]